MSTIRKMVGRTRVRKERPARRLPVRLSMWATKCRPGIRKEEDGGRIEKVRSQDLAITASRQSGRGRHQE